MASTPAGLAGPGAKFPQWTVSTEDYQVAEVINATEKALAEASVFPYSLIFFTNQADAETYAKAHGGGVDLTPLQTPANAVANGANALGGLGGWLAGISGFSGTNFVLRAVKVIAGGFLLIFGLTHLTGLNQIADQLKVVPLPV
jgi:hypothetical protein